MSNLILRTTMQAFIQSALLSLNVFVNKIQSMTKESINDASIIDKIRDYTGSRLGRWYLDNPSIEPLKACPCWSKLEPLLKSLHIHSADVLNDRVQGNIAESIHHNEKLIKDANQISKILNELNQFALTLSNDYLETDKQNDEDILF